MKEKFIPPFRRFVIQNFPFIEADFDALTSYELWSKVVEYLNKVIKSQNEVTAEMQRYIDYINNYFDNLDISEEVDSKLDEMASDGTLEAIINQEIFSELNTQVEANTGNISDLQTATSNLPTDESNIQALLKFNQFTNLPLKGGELSLPSEFSHYGFKLYRDQNGEIYDDLDLSSYDTTNIAYVDYDNGNDTTGSVIEPSTHPFKTVKGALDYINGISGNYYKIICKTYRFARDEFYSADTANRTYTLSKSVIIEPYDPTKTIVVSCDQRGLSWTRSGTLWTTTRSNVGYVYNLTRQDGFGKFNQLEKVDSLQECTDTVNSWYQSGSSLYLHTINNEEPTFDTYMITLTLSVVRFEIQNNRFLRLKNIAFYPYYGIEFNNSGNSYENALICENVKIFNQADDNGFTVSNVKKVYMINCVTGGNYADGFNYHFPNMTSETASTIIYEKNCKSFKNGLTYDRDICNCSTTHEGSNIIRVNGVYQTSKGPVIADIDSPKTMMIHCLINQTLNKKAIDFEDPSGDEGVGKAYFVDCQCLQTQSLSFNGSDNFDIKLKNFKGNYENEDLNITLYNE